MDTVINTFLETPMLMIAVIVFFLCVIIGFFGDMYLKKINKMKTSFDNEPEVTLDKDESTEENEGSNKETNTEEVAANSNSNMNISNDADNNTYIQPNLENTSSEQNNINDAISNVIDTKTDINAEDVLNNIF
mgnify:CR=1 FL=1|jgi:phosphatidate phosphatase PAH1